MTVNGMSIREKTKGEPRALPVVVAAHAVPEYGGLDNDRTRGRLRIALADPCHRPGYGHTHWRGDAGRMLSVAQPDFDPGGSLRTRRHRPVGVHVVDAARG